MARIWVPRNEFGNKTRGQRYRLLLNTEEAVDPNAFVLTTVINGAFSGYDSAGLGAITPATWNGETITAIGASTLGTDHVKVNFNNTQVPGVTSISVTFEGAADNPYVLPWNGTEYRLLGVVGTTLNTYLDGITGTDIDVTINDAT